MLSKYRPANKVFFRKASFLILAIVISLIFVGCGTKTDKKDENVEELARQGIAKFKYGKYADALEIFKIIKERHPFSRYGVLAELKAADSNFYLHEKEAALALYQDFEKNHPTNEAIPYVLYQIGECYYDKIDTADRDPGGAYDSIRAFNRLLKTFPDSSYATEARIKVSKANDFLARHELGVAKYYRNVKSYGEAKGRLEFLLANYPDSKSAVEAKGILASLPADKEPAKKE